MMCHRAVNCENIAQHVHGHLPLIDIPSDLPAVLKSTYDLVPYNDVTYDAGSVPPVFGILLEEKALLFCDCGKGYSDRESLRIHQTCLGKRQCRHRTQSPSFHMGYGQQLTGNRQFFEVDFESWRRTTADDTHYSLVYQKTLPPPRQYSKMEIKGAEDEMNTSSFFFTQKWIPYLKSYTSEEVLEVCKISSPEAPYGELLRKVAEQFLLRMNEEIKNHNSFGLLKLMGQTTERETVNRFGLGLGRWWRYTQKAVKLR